MCNRHPLVGMFDGYRTSSITLRSSNFLGLERVLAEHGDISYLWKNNVIVPQRDASPMNILDGDYVKIFVGEVDMQERCISESGCGDR